jgi:hypothetical protein
MSKKLPIEPVSGIKDGDTVTHDTDILSSAEAEAARVEALEYVEAHEGDIRAGLAKAIQDPRQTGITALRNAGLDPLRLWSLKAPKDAGGTVSAVFLQATSEVVILHQLTSGRFVVFEKSSVELIKEGGSFTREPA